MAEFKVTSDPPDWLQAIRDKQQPVAEAAVAALREVSAESVQEGRKDIAAAGRFGKTWQEGCSTAPRARARTMPPACRRRRRSSTAMALPGA